MRNTVRTLVLTVIALTTLATGTVSAQAATETPWFDSSVGLALQVVSVEGNGGTGATISTWQRGLTGWNKVLGGINGFVGENGIAPTARDGIPATPAGVFSLPSAFGTAPAPGGLLPYAQVGNDDWWDGDPKSPSYNTHQVCAPGTCPFRESESEQLAIPEYRYAVVMGVNAARIPGGGGAFFMHVANGRPTAGCVSMDQESLVRIIQWLLPGAVIAIKG